MHGFLRRLGREDVRDSSLRFELRNDMALRMRMREDTTRFPHLEEHATFESVQGRSVSGLGVSPEILRGERAGERCGELSRAQRLGEASKLERVVVRKSRVLREDL